jgi:Skp family chaperone for outer membrane proteins
MSFFRSKNAPPEFETADDVRRHFSHRIEDFLSEVEPRMGPWHSDRTLKDLLKWCRTTWEVKVRLQSTNADLDKKLTAARRDIENLSTRLTDETERRRKGEIVLSQTNINWEGILKEANDAHESELDAMEDAQAQDIRTLKARHAAEVRALNDRIQQLTGDIMITQPDSRAWTDEKLKKTFDELKGLIGIVTSPHSWRNPKERDNVRARIDPNGFLARQGEGQYHLLLKSVLWNILWEQFFSAPLGFGALGPGPGKATLLRVYSGWRSLFDGFGDTCESSLLIISGTSG